MMTNEDISERNGLLIDFIKELNLGIHVIGLPHKPKFLSSDYTTCFSAHVHNFHLILKPSDRSDEIFLDIRLKPTRNMDIDGIRQKMVEWFVLFEHTKIYTLRLKSTDMFVVGYNHHNKILKSNPYPVFARFDPLTYYELEKAESIMNKFQKYDLVIC